MSQTGFEYPAAPLSTAVAAPTSTTEAAQYASFEVYNNAEIQVVQTARGATPFLSTLIGIGRQKNGGNFKDLGLTEMVSTNFPEFKWKEEGEMQEVFVANSTINSSATSLVLLTTTGLIEGNILRNVTTNEQVRVSSITNGTTAVIQRAVGTKTAEASTSGDKYVVLATAVSKGIASVGTIGVAATDKSNYFQKFLTTVSSDDFNNLSYKVGDKNSLNIFMKDRAIVHARELEKQALFGQKKSGTDANGKAYYTMEGVVEMCKRGWTDDISNALTIKTLETALERPLRYTKNGSSLKIALCGTKVKGVLRELFRNDLQVGQIAEIDLTFDTVTLGTGKYVFVSHPMMDEDSGYSGTIAVVDPAFIKVVYPSGNDLSGAGFNGKTRFIYNKSLETFAYQEGSYVTYMSLMNANSNAGGLFRVVAE